MPATSRIPRASIESWRSFFADLADEAPDAAKELERPGLGRGARPCHRQRPWPWRGGAGQRPAVPAAACPRRHGRRRSTRSARMTLIRAYRMRGHLHRRSRSARPRAAAPSIPISIPRPTASPRPITTGRSSSTAARLRPPRPCARSWRAEGDLLRQGRRRIHAHPGARAAPMDPGAHRGAAQPDRIHARGQARDPRAPDRGRMLERFLDKRYTGTKRFGLEGGEALIPALEQVIKRGGQLGMKELVIGMPHRGRLNVLTNIMGKPFAALFSEFQGNPANPEDVQGSGDVKYHLGTSTDREFDGKLVHLSLHANPSHLEAVEPGRARQGARQAASARRHRARAGGRAADAWRRGFRRPGPGRRIARALGAQGLPHRRHDPFRRQQPDRLHHQPGLCALEPLSHRCRQDDPGADLPRQRRRSRSGGACRAHRHRIPPALQEGRGRRHVLLSPPRP